MGMRGVGAVLAAAFLLSCGLSAGSSAARAEVRFTVAAGGDVLLPPGTVQDQIRFFSPLSPLFKGADVGFINLEGPIGGDPSQAKSCRSKDCHLLRQPPGAAQALAASGVTVVSVANNHGHDMGPSGVLATDQALRQAGVAPIGRKDAPASILTIKGLRVAFLGFGFNGWTPDWRDFPKAYEAMRAARAQADVLIVSVHAGCEGESFSAIPQGHEFCYGEDRGDVRAFARVAAQAGAAVLIGHSPHVPRAIEWVGAMPAIYSLGNLATGPGVSVSGSTGLAPVAMIEITADKGAAKVSRLRVHSFVQTFGQGPRPDPSEAAARRMAALSSTYAQSAAR